MSLPAAVGETLSTAQTLLDVRDVHVRYGGVEAVVGASMTIDAPQIVGLIGPNGAGKSSLLAAIGGQAQSVGGKVWLGGKPLDRPCGGQRLDPEGHPTGPR